MNQYCAESMIRITIRNRAGGKYSELLSDIVADLCNVRTTHPRLRYCDADEDERTVNGTLSSLL